MVYLQLLRLIRELYTLLWQKVSIFGSIVDLRVLFLACWYWKKKLKSFPMIAKYITHYHKKEKNTRHISKKTNRKRLCHPPKRPNLGCQFGKKCRFSNPLSTYELYFWHVVHGKKIKIVPPISLKKIKKKVKKH